MTARKSAGNDGPRIIAVVPSTSKTPSTCPHGPPRRRRAATRTRSAPVDPSPRCDLLRGSRPLDQGVQQTGAFAERQPREAVPTEEVTEPGSAACVQRRSSRHGDTHPGCLSSVHHHVLVGVDQLMHGVAVACGGRVHPSGPPDRISASGSVLGGGVADLVAVWPAAVVIAGTSAHSRDPLGHACDERAPHRRHLGSSFVDPVDDLRTKTDTFGWAVRNVSDADPAQRLSYTVAPYRLRPS